VAAALAYDARRGPHSVGAHVRDAAAYVCWAFARAYEPRLLGGSFLGLAGPLLTAAVYDREVGGCWKGVLCCSRRPLAGRLFVPNQPKQAV
jgi:hypothetical protein